jgi:hypothetical protein
MQSFVFSRVKAGTLFCNHIQGFVPGTNKGFAIMAITLRPSDEQITLIDKLKRTLQVGTASKALFTAAAAYPKLKDELEREKQKSQRLEWALDALQRNVKDYDHARHDMMELANKKSA